MCTFNAWTVSGPDNPIPPAPQHPPTTDDAEQIEANQQPTTIQNLEDYKRNVWRICLPHFPYIIIFGSGVICSLIVMLLLNGFLSDSSLRKALMPHSLPDGHFLQVRDEFRVLAPQDDDGEGKRRQMAKERKKSPKGRRMRYSI